MGFRGICSSWSSQCKAGGSLGGVPALGGMAGRWGTASSRVLGDSVPINFPILIAAADRFSANSVHGFPYSHRSNSAAVAPLSSAEIFGRASPSWPAGLSYPQHPPQAQPVPSELQFCRSPAEKGLWGHRGCQRRARGAAQPCLLKPQLQGKDQQFWRRSAGDKANRAGIYII